MYEITGMDILSTLFLTLLTKSWFLPRICVKFIVYLNIGISHVQWKTSECVRGSSAVYVKWETS